MRGHRRRPTIEPQARLLIVCEGRVTEPKYFSDMRRAEEIRLVEIRIEGAGAVPRTVVQRALALKEEAEREAKRSSDPSLRFDEVWCVFDIDDHPRLNDAKQLADANEILLAISNPCFELWVLLHLKDQTAHIDRTKIASLCCQVMDQKRVNYGVIRERYDEAVRRASALHQRQCQNGCEGDNPTTHVHRLTERLLSLSREARLKAVKGR
jgi:hypothetical protein